MLDLIDSLCNGFQIAYQIPHFYLIFVRLSNFIPKCSRLCEVTWMFLPSTEFNALPRKLPRTRIELEPPSRELRPTTRELPPTTRELPPTHYIFKIESFSDILTIFPEDKEAKYDSDVFESGGYKWYVWIHFYVNMSLILS